MPQPSFLHSSDSSSTGGWSAAPIEALREVEMPSKHHTCVNFIVFFKIIIYIFAIDVYCTLVV